MTVFTDTWNAAFQADPADTDDADEGAANIRQTRVAVAERLVVDHSWAGDGQDGKHKVVNLLVQSTPTAEASVGQIYSKDVDSKAELHYQDEDSNEIQFTTGGNRIGLIIQSVRATKATHQGITSQIDFDDTIPGSGEGAEVLTASITPKLASSVLRVKVFVPVWTMNGITAGIFALFRDSGASAIAVASQHIPTNGYLAAMDMEHQEAASAASATTFKLRAGAATISGANLYINGSTTARLFGGKAITSMVIDEIAAI